MVLGPTTNPMQTDVLEHAKINAILHTSKYTRDPSCPLPTCARARVVHDYMSVIPRAKPIRQQPKPSTTSWPRHLQKILHWPCTKFAKILGSWARSCPPSKIVASWARSWPHGQDRGLMGKILASWARS